MFLSVTVCQTELRHRAGLTEDARLVGGALFTQRARPVRRTVDTHGGKDGGVEGHGRVDLLVRVDRADLAFASRRVEEASGTAERCEYHKGHGVLTRHKKRSLAPARWMSRVSADVKTGCARCLCL